MSGHCDLIKPDHGPVRDIAASVGVELRGDEGQPYHCGTRMQVKSGIAGPDYARCEACGLTIANGLSPHINGGYVLDEAVFDDHPDGAWAIVAGDAS